MKPLNLFYEESDNDRWFPFDRYPRQVIRRLVRGNSQPGGQARVFLNLCAGLDRIGVSYRVNDYSYIKKNPDEIACIIGKPHVLNKINWRNPVLFGAAVFSHPCDDLNLFNRLPILRILVPGEWIREMFLPYYGNKVISWPVGIDTEKWAPFDSSVKDIDILLYDKIRWKHDEYEKNFISPIRSELAQRNLKTVTLQYGFYQENDFYNLLKRSKAMLFLCEHETQGIAYQQALSCNVPIFAWDRGGFWQDPIYYPHKVQYGPVTSVPYWDDRCGLKFESLEDFPHVMEEFSFKLKNSQFAPRDYILEHLTLEKCAQKYGQILKEAQKDQ